MVQLRFLNGKRSGSVQVLRSYPCSIGRNPSSDVLTEEAGVWDRHCEIDLELNRGFTLKTEPKAITSVNGEPVQQAVLKNGDRIDIGALKIQFWLNPSLAKSFRIRELLTWVAFVFFSLGQVALFYWLPK